MPLPGRWVTQGDRDSEAAQTPAHSPWVCRLGQRSDSSSRNKQTHFGSRQLHSQVHT